MEEKIVMHRPQVSIRQEDDNESKLLHISHLKGYVKGIANLFNLSTIRTVGRSSQDAVEIFCFYSIIFL